MGTNAQGYDRRREKDYRKPYNTQPAKPAKAEPVAVLPISAPDEESERGLGFVSWILSFIAMGLATIVGTIFNILVKIVGMILSVVVQAVVWIFRFLTGRSFTRSRLNEVGFAILLVVVNVLGFADLPQNISRILPIISTLVLWVWLNGVTSDEDIPRWGKHVATGIFVARFAEWIGSWYLFYLDPGLSFVAAIGFTVVLWLWVTPRHIHIEEEVVRQEALPRLSYEEAASVINRQIREASHQYGGNYGSVRDALVATVRAALGNNSADANEIIQYIAGIIKDHVDGKVIRYDELMDLLEIESGKRVTPVFPPIAKAPVKTVPPAAVTTTAPKVEAPVVEKKPAEAAPVKSVSAPPVKMPESDQKTEEEPVPPAIWSALHALAPVFTKNTDADKRKIFSRLRDQVDIDIDTPAGVEQMVVLINEAKTEMETDEKARLGEVITMLAQDLGIPLKNSQPA